MFILNKLDAELLADILRNGILVYHEVHSLVSYESLGHCAEFLNFDKIETYKDFGGIRIEDDVLITKDGCRFLGTDRIPYHPKDVEEYMAAHKGEIL